MNEPIRHHFIPQFILHNFCFNERKTNYYDIKAKTIMVKNTREIFMEKNLYRDELNSAAEPTQIEKDFAKVER